MVGLERETRRCLFCFWDGGVGGDADAADGSEKSSELKSTFCVSGFFLVETNLRLHGRADAGV